MSAYAIELPYDPKYDYEFYTTVFDQPDCTGRSATQWYTQSDNQPEKWFDKFIELLINDAGIRSIILEPMTVLTLFDDEDKEYIYDNDL